ncbi:BnaC03g62370D [Brassica napus]|uniref:BnaC03g62370D protein n=1 Tax=Brassica napus TaxID=3708 RepID=A0A078HUY8_BRANA|nr:BnaC03g62370D [Brassica napus]
MEKVVKAFERVNTSKGGRAIPEDQRPDCFFFVADTCVAMKE